MSLKNHTNFAINKRTNTVFVGNYLMSRENFLVKISLGTYGVRLSVHSGNISKEVNSGKWLAEYRGYPETCVGTFPANLPVT